jgi:4-amino-4-deoxy-L-arabinose transferase-like glycosyltransferase
VALDAPATQAADADADADAGIAVAAVDDPPTRTAGTGRQSKSGSGRLQMAAVPVLTGVIALVLRLLTAATGPTDWDSAQYAAAVGHYDVTHGQPQPPGYWLYVACGRLIHELFGLGVVHSLVVVSALASAAATGMTALAGRDLGGRWVGLAAGLIMATSPFVWFSGSIVATYSFDALACALLIDLAWRARPGSWHGIGAAVAFGLLAGFRQSIVQSFFLLALIAVVAATRRWTRLGVTVTAGVAAAAVWFVPMALEQPGGVAAWWRATRIESTGAAHATSVLDHAPGGATNLGTFAAYTVMALAPLAALTVLAALVLAIRRLVGAHPAGRHTHRPLPRPWYQRRIAILAAAILPPVALVSLVQFAKGGYALAYFPAATIALLLPVAAVIRRARSGTAGLWLSIATVGVVAVAALSAQRFLDGAGVLPTNWTSSPAGKGGLGLWVGQPRYQAPYADTRSAIDQSDQLDIGLRTLAPHLRFGRDVVVLDTLDGGVSFYRGAGWALPDARIALVAPGQVVYNEQGGALYYAEGTPAGASVAVGPSGSVVLVASPALPGLARLAAAGDLTLLSMARPIGDYRVWQVRPGVTILGVPVVERAGRRPLGGGVT